MKTNRWLFHLAIVLINLLRLLLSMLMFWRFFLFKIVDVTAIFLAYLLLDSAEGVLVFYRRDIWSTAKRIVHYINNSFFVFSVISGILLRLPIQYFFNEVGWNVENIDIMKLWIFSSLSIFIITTIFSSAVSSVWGNIQNLATRFCFLAYCSVCLWPERALLIPFVILTAACILGIEIKKYGWSLHELRKKDIRFRKIKWY